MHALAGAVKDHIAISQTKSGACERCGAGWKGKEDPFGEQRNIGDAGKAFATPINFQMLHSEPCQSSLEISGTCYRESDAGIPESGRVPLRIVKRQCTALCHLPRPVGPADSSCDLLKVLGLAEGGSIEQPIAFGYAGSELLG